jgi:hypothetical protein
MTRHITSTTSLPYQVPDDLHAVAMIGVEQAAGYMVIDTACQRLCHGQLWRQAHEKLLKQSRLTIQFEPERESFQFGAGEPQHSEYKAYCPQESEVSASF